MFAAPWEPFPRPSGQPSPTAARRLQRDFQRLLSEPIDGIIAVPNEANILEWHYVITGSPDTPYEGGYYYGKLLFQPDFPWKPPAICMLTPNGRFETNTRLCLSISDFHPESWNPGWTVSAILVGLHSFMNEETFAAGVRNDSDTVRRKYAADSKAWNLAVMIGFLHCSDLILAKANVLASHLMVFSVLSSKRCFHIYMIKMTTNWYVHRTFVKTLLVLRHLTTGVVRYVGLRINDELKFQ
ncbi:unnamed protein product [Strongylus vulgaris]|uniref:UBC core domain-containing protein n=1 Tax=Strongylus vulgaris TaxID=40348 RepID=A0A3P7IAS7_STRVU|nr:unnamed protein product [Strongylus vulgaris]